MTRLGRSEYVYNPECGCRVCENRGVVPQGTADNAANGGSFGYGREHVPPRMSERDVRVVIGHAPEHRDWFDKRTRGLEPEIHPTVRIEAFVTVDSGIDRPTRVGSRTWLMKKVHVGHDAQIGRNCDLAPLSNIGGYAEIGDNVKIGMSAVVLPYRKVGNGAHIGAGAVVTKDVPAGETWVGNPARMLEDTERDPRPHSERSTLAEAA